MRTRTTLIASALLAFTLPLATASAHEEGGGYRYYNQHERDHAVHRGFHESVNEAHARAHEEGFSSRWEHRAYHRALRDLHGDFHENHPNTQRDHYRWWR